MHYNYNILILFLCPPFLNSDHLSDESLAAEHTQLVRMTSALPLLHVQCFQTINNKDFTACSAQQHEKTFTLQIRDHICLREILILNGDPSKPRLTKLCFLHYFFHFFLLFLTGYKQNCLKTHKLWEQMQCQIEWRAKSQQSSVVASILHFFFSLLFTQALPDICKQNCIIIFETRKSSQQRHD